MSRRALRESERAHAQATLSRSDEADTEEEAVDQQIWVQPPGPEPLHYTTQVRPQMPHYDGQSFRARQGDDAQPAAETPPYRLRDFSPEARGTLFTATQPTPSAPWEPPANGSGDLDYHTSVEAVRPVPTAYSEPVSAPSKLGTPESTEAAEESSHVDSHEDQSDLTLSRRELRALRNASTPVVDDQPVIEDVAPVVSELVVSEFVVESSPAPIVEPETATVVEDLSLVEDLSVVEDVPVIEDALIEAPLPLVAPRPDPSAEVEAAMAEFDALYLHRNLPEEAPDQSVRITPVEVTAVEVGPEEIAPEEIASAEIASAEIVLAEAPVVEDVDLLHTLVEPAAPAPIAPTAVIPSAPVAQPAQDAPIREVVTAPEVYTKPIGHWSTQAGIDDENQVSDHTLSRDLAASDAITTSALVLPNFPQSGPFTGPVSSTGEILITGSIDLPRSLGMSGGYASRYDSLDVDAIIDGTDREDAAPDSAPVRAIRAVSTHTSSQGIIATKRPKGNNLPVILSITAGVMAVSVVVLFVAGMIFKIF